MEIIKINKNILKKAINEALESVLNNNNDGGIVTKEDIIRMFGLKEATTLNGYAWERKFKKRNYHGYIRVYPNLLGGYVYFISLFRYEPNGEDIPMFKHIENTPEEFLTFIKDSVNPIIKII